MKSTKFVGRDYELKKLAQFMDKTTASMIVIRGRRRLGKSTLAKEFGKNFTFYGFEGVPPVPETTMQMELDEFSRQLAKTTGMPEVKVDDWSKLFQLLADRAKTGRVVILFDEISWMGSQDPLFLGKIKMAWDNYFKNNPKLMLIICGSASSWIEKNILSSTGFVGRISYSMVLQELPANVIKDFWNNSNISAYEICKILSVTGGVPKYLEEINIKVSAEENIQRLCFTAGGFLVDEFDKIFSDLFLRESDNYKKIVEFLSSGLKDIPQIAENMGAARAGRLSEYLRELELAGFIDREYSWNLKDRHEGALSKYRLKDCYLRFYMKYIAPNLGMIRRNDYGFTQVSALSNWDTIMGLQFENLVLNNRKLIHKALDISNEEMVWCNPYFQRPTLKTKGCQIDYLIQSKFNTLYICEMKFSRNPVGREIIAEMQAKIDAISRPKYMSVRPVLIHVGGATEELVDSGFFADIIDFGKFIVN